MNNPLVKAYMEDEISRIIESKVRGNVGEDGLIVVDYAELRDALLAASIASTRKTLEDLRAKKVTYQFFALPDAEAVPIEAVNQMISALNA